MRHVFYCCATTDALNYAVKALQGSATGGSIKLIHLLAENGSGKQAYLPLGLYNPCDLYICTVSLFETVTIIDSYYKTIYLSYL